jgi:aspartate-semialdehyde dehydrogenase
VVLSHNTIRGAAGAAVLNAEVLARLGKLAGGKVKESRASAEKAAQQPAAVLA